MLLVAEYRALLQPQRGSEALPQLGEFQPFCSSCGFSKSIEERQAIPDFPVEGTTPVCCSVSQPLSNPIAVCAPFGAPGSPRVRPIRLRPPSEPTSYAAAGVRQPLHHHTILIRRPAFLLPPKPPPTKSESLLSCPFFLSPGRLGLCIA